MFGEGRLNSLQGNAGTNKKLFCIGNLRIELQLPIWINSSVMLNFPK